MMSINKLFFLGIYFNCILVTGATLNYNLTYFNCINIIKISYPIQATSEIEKLNKKIEQLNLGNFDPIKFELVKADIEGSYIAKKITKSVKESLLKDVNSILALRIFNESEKFLNKTSGNCSKEISWLNLLESKIGKNQKITSYKIKLNEQSKQIDLYNYYSILLPKEIRKWINSGESNFTMAIYTKYVSQISDMPSNFKYKNESRLVKIHNEIRNELDALLIKWNSTD